MLGIDTVPIGLFLVFAAPASLWVLALIDVLRGRRSGRQKALWFAFVLLVPVIGFIVYFAKGRGREGR